jgi:hypothetical protein
MNIKKQLGIWMDYSNAHVMEYKLGFVGKRVIHSDISKKIIAEGDFPGDSITGYYDKLKEIIKDYDELVLFGPTQVQTGLQNVLLSDSIFNHIHIELKEPTKLTDMEQYDFVKKYFLKTN